MQNKTLSEKYPGAVNRKAHLRLSSKFAPPSLEHPARQLIRTAQRKSSETRPRRPSTPLEAFGIAICVWRNKKQLSMQDIASKSGIESERLLALEMGALSVDEVAEILPGLAQGLGENFSRLAYLLQETVVTPFLSMSETVE